MSLPPDIKPRKPTRLMIEDEKTKILNYIMAGATDAAIMAGLKIPRRTFERRMKSIREGHLKGILNQQDAKVKASALMICQEKMRWLEMQAQKIVMDSTVKTFDRLQAMDRVRQYQIDYAKLLIEGPSIFQVVPRDGLHLGDKRTAAELRDAPLLSDFGEESGEPIPTNPEEQF
jgi:hypothetical protein